MSYRTSINKTQIFGNNECYQKWMDFIRSEGIEIDEDGSYDGYTENLQGMFDVIDTITRGLINDRHNQVVAGETWRGKPYRELTDLSESMWLDDKTPLLMYNMEMIEHAYCFLPYQAFKAVENLIEKSDVPYYISDDGKEWLFCSYKLKDGERIHVCAG